MEPGRHMDKSAVEEERLVQRGKGVVLRLRTAAEVLFENAESAASAAARFDTSRPPAVRAADKRAAVMAIHKHQPRPGSWRKKLSQPFWRRHTAGSKTGLNGSSRRRDVGEAPVLMLQRGEAEFREAREARLAQRQQPGRLQERFKAVEVLEEQSAISGLDVFCVMI